MQIDVGAYIAELLYEHDSVNIPGLGGFTTRYKPASIDQVQGKLLPPAKEVHFDEHLVADDGLLMEYIVEKNELSAAAAEKAVAEYVAGVREALSRREIVIFPRVGRLYKDFEKKLQFLPDNTNFNTESFGLPAVHFYPAEKQAKAAGTPAVTAKPMPPAKKEKELSAVIADYFQRYLPIIGAVSVIIIGVGLYLLLQDRGRPTEITAQKEEIPSSRLNTRPGGNEGQENAASLDDPEDINDMENEAADTDPLDTEASTTPPGRKFAIIAVGVFRDPDNVTNLTEEIYKAGYEPYTEQVNNMIRVGIQFAYDEYPEVESTLQDVRNRFNPEAFVFKRE